MPSSSYGLLFVDARARLFVSKNMDDYIPGEGAVLRFFAGGGRRRGPSSNPANRDPQRQAALRLARRPENGGSGLRCWPRPSGATTSRARPTTRPATVQTSVTPHHLNSTSYTQNSFLFYRNPIYVPDPSLGVGGRVPDSVADLLRHKYGPDFLADSWLKNSTVFGVDFFCFCSPKLYPGCLYVEEKRASLSPSDQRWGF